MNIRAYLDRIDYHSPLEPTAETLRALHMAHMLAVPFENLNIGRGWPIVLDQDALFEKIVVRRRGGFCYELNGLFAALLRALGFEVTLLSAGVARADGGFGPEFDHLTLLVTTDDRRPTNDQRPTTTADQATRRQAAGGRRLAAETLRTTDYGLRTNLQSAICNLQSAIWLADVGFGDSFHMLIAWNRPSRVQPARRRAPTAATTTDDRRPTTDRRPSTVYRQTVSRLPSTVHR